ncbi:MAG TPA: metal-dependent hydrolase [Noviherbaspirillum sp.]|nr:metal-dependent hydrolase [Noviherbaspirillum sp.]
MKPHDVPHPLLQPRRLQHAWPHDLPRYWNRGEVFRTHYMNALSLLFPDGEQHFIDSVRAFRHANDDPRLERDIRGFIGQEGWHRHEHGRYNRWLGSLGYPAAKLEARIRRNLDNVKKLAPKIDWLAQTVCLEHFTAIMAQALLKHPDWLADMHPHFRKVWLWHALEELEHKAVAFDLYTRVGGSYARRVWAMLVMSFFFPFDTLWNLTVLLYRDKQLFRPRVWWQGVRFFFGNDPGLFWKILPAYLRFFKRSFHPWNEDDRYLIRQALAWLEELGETPHHMEEGRQ